MFSIFKQKKQDKIKIGGAIAFYGLEDWWLKTLTEEDRGIVRKINSEIDIGNNDYTYLTIPSFVSVPSKTAFLSNLTDWINKPEYYELNKKILKEAESYIFNSDVSDKHYFYMHCIKVHYKNRELDEMALLLTIEYCLKQISVNKEFAEWNFNKGFNLPSHTGYKQLAIIYEKQGEVEEALKLTREAQENGWNPSDCSSRIKRLEKKLLK